MDFGQFKEKVDDGLLLRRACFHCLKSLCEHLLGSVYLPPLLHSLLNGVGDEDRDVQLLAYSCLGVLAASLPPTRLLPHLDTLPALLMNGVKANIRLAKVGNTGSYDVVFVLIDWDVAECERSCSSRDPAKFRERVAAAA